MYAVTAARRVRQVLAAERRRGTPFELAWERALAAAGRDAAALEWARDEWEAAYERRAGRYDAFTPLERERTGVEVLA